MAAYQIPLHIKLDDAATFDNYLTGANRGVLDILRGAGEPSVYLWSSAATGKTHLLQACCQALPAGQAIYLPMQELFTQPAAMLEGLEQFTLVCIDDVHQIAGDRQWETGLFHLYNRMRQFGHRMCLSANAAPLAIGVSLPDLHSRFSWGPVFQLLALDDAEKIQAMQMRAGRRGFELPDDVAAYLLKRYPRDMHQLFGLLDKLDIASLQAQRRLTIPFVKQYLSPESA